MQDRLPASAYWWRYFIYGALFHIAALTPACRSEKYANAFRLAGYAVGGLPVLLREGVIAAVWMLVLLYGLTFALKYLKNIFK